MVDDYNLENTATPKRPRPRKASDKPPKPGEDTAGQGGLGRIGMASFMGAMQGFRQPPPGTYITYREMRCNPTVALARVAGWVPIKGSQWTIEEEEGAPAGALDLLEDMLLPMRSAILADAMFALDYGFAPWEKVWALEDGKLTIEKLKPLLIEKTRILVDKDTGDFMGFKNFDAELVPNKCLLWTYDREAGNLAGRPRMENIRKAWSAWNDTFDRLGAYFTKVSGVIPLIEYPEGQNKDASGAKIDNYEIAVQILQSLGKGIGVAMPNTLARVAREMANAGLSEKMLKAWNITFLEASSGHGAEALSLLQHWEKLIMRGWLVPERSATEAITAGSRADSDTAADLALLVAQDTLDDLIESLNKNLVDEWLELNYGPETKGLVYLKAEPLDNPTRRMVREMLKAVLTAPVNADMFFRVLDVDNMLDQVGLPRAADTAEVDLLIKQEEQENARLLAQELSKQPPVPGRTGGAPAAPPGNAA